MGDRLTDWFSDKKFGVEHALNMYASSFVTMPAMGIYEDDVVKQFAERLSTCHIYLIGQLPRVAFVGAAQEGSELITKFEIAGHSRDLRWPIPEGAKLIEKDGIWLVVDEEAVTGGFPSEIQIAHRLAHELAVLHFEVLYIGQAYGEDGSRNALHRLKSHSTLQQIAVQGIPDGFQLTLLMLEVLPANRLLTIFNPRAKVQDQAEERIRNGLDKLFSTTEPERITLYEASLIRYFQPKFNKEFKNSFPSTNMKLLASCYEKDISAVIAEICFDELPFTLFSNAAKATRSHIARHSLHTTDDRNAFFDPTK